MRPETGSPVEGGRETRRHRVEQLEGKARVTADQLWSGLCFAVVVQHLLPVLQVNTDLVRREGGGRRGRRAGENKEGNSKGRLERSD